MSSVVISVGDEEIEIHELAYVKSKEWDKRAEDAINNRIETQDAIANHVENDDIVSAFQAHVDSISDEHLDVVYELVIERVPEEKRERFAQNVTKTELLVAFNTLVEQANLTVFFSSLIVTMRANGEPESAIGMNSPDLNGDSGLTN